MDTIETKITTVASEKISRAIASELDEKTPSNSDEIIADNVILRRTKLNKLAGKTNKGKSG